MKKMNVFDFGMLKLFRLLEQWLHLMLNVLPELGEGLEFGGTSLCFLISRVLSKLKQGNVFCMQSCSIFRFNLFMRSLFFPCL